MIKINGQHWIECQQCGDPVRPASREEQEDIVYHPYRYILYCTPCIKSGLHIPDRI